MDRELKIKVVLDRSAVSAQAQSVAAEVNKANRAAAAEAKKLAKEEAKAAQEAAREAIKASREKAAEAKKLAQEEAKAAKEAARAAVMASREKAAEARAAAESERASSRDAARAAREAARDGARAAKEAAREKIEATKQALAAEKSAAKDAAKAARESASQKAAAYKESAKAAAQEQVRLEGGASAAMSAAKSVASFAAGMIGLGTASAAVGMVIEHFRAVNRSIFEAAGFVQDYREALIELSALRDQMGKSTVAVGEDISFRSKTLQTAENSRKFREAFLGEAESAMDKDGVRRLIDPSQAQQAEVNIGSMQGAQGGDAATYGRLAGLIPQLLGRRTDANEITQNFAQLYNLFRPGGFTFTSGAGQYAKNAAPLVGAKSWSMMDAGAVMSALSISNPEGAGEELQQATRALLGGIDKTGKPRVADGTPVGEYYKSLGINTDLLKGIKPEKQGMEILGRITDDILNQENKAKARGEEFNRLVYMKHKGYGNQEEANSLLHLISLKESGTLQTFLDLAGAKALPTVEEAMKPTREAQRTDHLLQTRKSKLDAEKAKIIQGIGMPEFVANAQRSAYANLGLPGEYGEHIRNALITDGEDYLRRQQTELESQRLLFAEAKKYGIETPNVDIYGSLAPRAPATKIGERYIGDEELYKISQKIMAKGGPMIPKLEELDTRTQAAVNAAGTAQGLDMGAPGQAAPAPGMEKTNRLLERVNATLESRLPQAGRPGPAAKPPETQRR